MSTKNIKKTQQEAAEEAFLIDQQLQLTVEDDFSYFCKFDDLLKDIQDQKETPKGKSTSTSRQDQELKDKYRIEDDFSYFCIYDDLMEPNEIKQGQTEEEETDKIDDNTVPHNNRDLTPEEWEQGLGILFNIGNSIERTKKISAYFNGEITINELLTNADEETIQETYTLINRILNFKRKGKRYYIELPIDIFFYPPHYGSESRGHILAFELDENLKDSHMVKLTGPNKFSWGTYVIKNSVEIEGNFAQIPNGACLSLNDYLQIIKKHPHIIEHLIHLMKTDSVLGHHYIDKSDEEMQEIAQEWLERWINNHPHENQDLSEAEKNGYTILSQETIDSITFVEPIEYITLEEVKNGTIGSFEEVLIRIKSEKVSDHPSEETPKTLKLIPPQDTKNN